MKTCHLPKLQAAALVGALVFISSIAHAADLSVSVQGAGSPIAGSAVTVYAAGTGSPTQLAQGKTDDNGTFTLAVEQPSAESVLYIVAKGGTPKATADKGANDAITLLAVLGTTSPSKITVNEFSTVASAVTCAHAGRWGRVTEATPFRPPSAIRPTTLCRSRCGTPADRCSCWRHTRTASRWISPRISAKKWTR